MDNRGLITLVVAMDAAQGIGINNALPWRLPEDLAHFKRTTIGRPVVMGRRTFESIGRPLPNRRNIVITRNTDWTHAGVETVHSVREALELVAQVPCCVIGGAQIFSEVMPHADRMIVTEIARTFPCDTFFPLIKRDIWREVVREQHYSEANACDYAFVTYERIR